MYKNLNALIPLSNLIFQTKDRDIKIKKAKIQLNNWTEQTLYIFASEFESVHGYFSSEELSCNDKNLRQMFIDRNGTDPIKELSIRFLEPGSQIIYLDNTQHIIDKSSYILINYEKSEIKVVYKLRNILTEEVYEKDYFDSAFLKIF